ncbi:HIT domain-containing protein [Moritella sp. Urea-trap-13]|uniref:HIT domain-containing protein n=1 Tax=Moritella sp. Urea-trap-13 TaxID=2058327 RepID=UPI000C33AC6B|nr:HIT domain-containing protein [Moritella sp. Urea-trap-13]PKH06872.1 diadenosine tetraphosphate hydrolase [Moritella sp. Urea-trap-13]
MTQFILHPQLAVDTVLLGEFPLCQVLLANDGNFPWLILVPKVNGITEFHDLTDEQQLQFLSESNAISKLLKDGLSADKINIAALGNMVPQLHIHHVARFKEDACWPKPIWGQIPAVARTEQQTIQLTTMISTKLQAGFIAIQA